ncbi:penicillin acylase family protein [Leptolyngbya sp. 7M]|uniref:penicillin acylase family protein n=1 Tax=Leptolyngbya sp. 7M TaxID=2812896 RepID=UPI001B8CEA8B|nr:penicillin acylase family protein [Leptolyngbya sp. 7M]QYO66979.1 penicillin acylase family protein [Leptolyngbya sp. 7M]
MKRLFILPVFIVSVGLFFISTSAQTSVSELKLLGLKEPVTVIRDGRWVPYIEAKSEADLMFAQGYVTASDRLWQMEMMRRVARGETAELFGRIRLDEDKRWRRFGFSSIAEQTLKETDKPLREALEQYARGVNAYIDSLTSETLPPEFKILQVKPRHWTPADSIVIGKILADALSTTFRADLIRESLIGFDAGKLADLTNPISRYDVILFGKDVEKGSLNTGYPPSVDNRSDRLNALLAIADEQMRVRKSSLGSIGLYAEDLAASNNWVISGKRTADGKPILANDPHLAPTAPGIWYIVQLAMPGNRVAGVSLPGVAGVVLGHNEHIAWGATNVGPDVQDLYHEEFNSEGKYRTPTGWAEPNIRREEIRVRENLLSPNTVAESFEVKETRNGPVIIETGGQVLSLKWTALDPKNREFDAFYNLNRVRDWNEFKKALSNYGGPTQNFVYADVKGNIGWHIAGKIPIRKEGDGGLPYKGATSDGDWIGWIPFDELPNLYNPPAGFIVTANQRIAGTGYRYPQLIRDFAPPWRARRLQDLLSADPKATMDSTTAAQMDSYSIPHSMLAKEIVGLGSASEDTIKILREWDGRMVPGSQAALLVNEIRTCVSNKIAAANRPVPANIIRERLLHWIIGENVKRWLPAGYDDYPSLLRACDTEAAAAFTRSYGNDRGQWTFGKVNPARFQHPLAAAPLVGGQFATPSAPTPGTGSTPNVGSGVSMRLIASPGNWDATRLVIPLGQSGLPNSPYYKDQFESWLTGMPAVLPFSPESVKKAAKSELRLVP